MLNEIKITCSNSSHPFMRTCQKKKKKKKTIVHGSYPYIYESEVKVSALFIKLDKAIQHCE
jgi:hypothetical protein